MKLHTLFLGIIFFFNLPCLQSQTPGTLDLTYGNAGKISFPISCRKGSGLNFSGMKKLPDGKILSMMFRYFYDEPSDISYDSASLIKFLDNGNPDLSFGTKGEIKLDYLPNDLLVQDDGKILVSGIEQEELVLKKYQTNGTLDLTYGHAGSVYTGIFSSISSATQAPNGKLFFAGSVNESTELLIANLEKSGMRNFEFGKDGLFVFDFDANNYFEFPYKIALQPDGKIIVAGNDYAASSQIFICRFHPSGKIDSSFSTDGRMRININMNLQELKLLEDGKMVLGGTYYFSNYTRSGFALARVNANGTADATFGGTGLKTFNYGGLNDYLYTLLLQEDGKILVAGESNGKFALARINPNGLFDMTFNGSGKNITPSDPGSTAIASYMTLEANEKIMLYGTLYLSDSSMAFCRARYHSGKTVGLTDGHASGQIRVYPNPFINQVELELDAKESGSIILSLFNSQGGLIQNLLDKEQINKGPHTLQLPLPADLNPGIYFLHIQQGEKEEWVKLVKI